MNTNSIAERVKERESKVDYYKIVLQGEIIVIVETMRDAQEEVKLHPGSCYTPVYKNEK